MILVNGECLGADQAGEILDRLPELLLDTLSRPGPDPLVTIGALDRLARMAEGGAYASLLQPWLNSGLLQQEQIDQVCRQLSREALLFKLRTELGASFPEPEACIAPGGGPTLQKRWMPLGTLLHIAAGNVEALPAYSVAEGLLLGNINLLKLPSMDDGLSIRLLEELIRLEPQLARYVYVFDTPSSDLETLKRLANLADGIVVWGSDAAVQAARRMAPLNARIIEWGHKLSFAYVTPHGVTAAQLEALARHIFETGQLYCSSCQGLYIDTDSREVLEEFCRIFLPILDEAGRRHPRPDMGLQAQLTLQRLTRQLEGPPPGVTVYNGDMSSLSLSMDSRLELSGLLGNCWVKPLPRDRLVSVLRPYKSYLQTAGLLCGEQEYGELADRLCRAGLIRVTGAGNMSYPVPGAAHDGEYPLRRYARLVDIDRF